MSNEMKHLVSILRGDVFYYWVLEVHNDYRENTNFL